MHVHLWDHFYKLLFVKYFYSTLFIIVYMIVLSRKTLCFLCLYEFNNDAIIY